MVKKRNERIRKKVEEEKKQISKGTLGTATEQRTGKKVSKRKKTEDAILLIESQRK